MPREIVYDLTEMLLASTGKLQYYGIVRVVAEIGMELAARRPDVRFCVFSAGHRAFFEIAPVRDSDGHITFDVPQGIRQLRIRSVFHQRKPVRDALAGLARGIADMRNRRAWAEAGVDLPKIDLDGKTLVSCGRPKLMVEQLATCKARGWDVAFVPLLHDMIPLHDHFSHRAKSFPSNFINDNIHLLDRSEMVLTNSAFTRDEILAFAADGHLPPIDPGKVHAVPLVHECPEGTEAPLQTPPSEPYVLTVGALLGRKNLEAVFEAVKLLKAKGGPVPRIVIAGARRHRTEKRLEEEDMAPLRGLVDFYHSPNQTDLVALYENAVALILASRMEGWGLPAGEALWLGTPAICADVPALREVGGDLALYFDPDDPGALAAHIARLMEDEADAQAHRARIRSAKGDLRTWKDVAAEIDALLG